MSVTFLLFHCNSDYSVGQSVDDAGAADAVATDAGAASDASGWQDGGALADTSTTPDALPPSSRSFCADAGAALFCADFDDNVDAGWVGLERSGGGSLSVLPTFSGGSAPNALVGALSSVGGSALLVTRSIPIGATGISISFSFDASAVTQPVTAVLGDFGLTKGELASLQSPTAFFCFGNLATAAAGRNVVEMRLTPNASMCTINGDLIVTQTGPLPSSVILRLGVAGSDAGVVSIAFDDFVVRSL
jgi:hypothetical protein